MSNFGLTFRNSKWSDYALTNVSLKTIDRSKRLVWNIFLILVVIFLTNLFYYDFFWYLQLIGFSPAKEGLWLLFDWTTLTLVLLFQNYRVYFNQLTQYLFKSFFTDKTVKNVFSKNEHPSNVRKLTPKTPNAMFTNQQLSNILVNYLTTQHAANNPLSKQLSLKLFQSLNPNSNLTNTLSCFKRLFTVVDVLHKPTTGAIDPSALRSDIQKNRILQLLTHSSFQNYTPLILDFYLHSKKQTPLIPHKPFSQFTWSLDNFNVEGLSGSELSQWKSGPFYYSNINTLLLNQYQNDNRDYEFWNDSMTQQRNFFKWMRWLYRYSILHRNLLTHSRKITNLKKLLSTGFFSSNMSEQNLWISNYLNSNTNPSFVKNSWLTFYRSLAQNTQGSDSYSSASTSLIRKSLPMLSNYEHSYFFYLHRFEFYNTLPNLTLSSDLGLGRNGINSTTPNPNHYYSTPNLLHSLLKSSLIVNHDLSTFIYVPQMCRRASNQHQPTPKSNIFLESDKSLLSNRSNIETWLNLLEDSEAKKGSRELSYYQHTLISELSPNLSGWGWNDNKSPKVFTQKPLKHFNLELLYTNDLHSLFQIISKN